MKFKKKLRKFFTLTRKGTGGFTLVELIVVIAILAILAGVGAAGYGGYVKNANKGNDKVLVGNVIRALETSAYSGYTNFAVDSQYSQGIQIPVGFVVISNESLTTVDGKSGYMLALSNDEADPIGKSLAASMGEDYATTMRLSYDGWRVGAVSSSSLHNATAGMMDKIDNVGELMIALDNVVENMTKGEYNNTGELIISVSQRIADYNGDGKYTKDDKDAFVAMWASSYDKSVSEWGFGVDSGGRESYSAVRMAYSNAFAEYVRANYDGSQNVTTLANDIANYGKPAGDLAYEEAYEIAYNKAPFLKDTAGKAAGEIARAAADSAAPGATFPYAATIKAFDDANYAGNRDAAKVKALYNEWIKGQDEKDAALFYDTMLTAATDGSSYAEENGSDKFTTWFTEQAAAYSENFSEVERLVAGKSAIAIVVYYQDGILSCEVAPFEANPRED